MHFDTQENLQKISLQDSFFSLIDLLDTLYINLFAILEHQDSKYI